MVRFTDGEYARFLALFEQSGTLSKAAFVKARVFGDEFRVIRSDRGTMEFAARLTAFNAQFRKIGVNYNQIVKELHAHFSPKRRSLCSINWRAKRANWSLWERK